MPVDVTNRFIRIRQHSPGLYSTFRQGALNAAKGIYAVYGKRKNSQKWEIQSLLFDRKQWDTGRARSWVSSHGYVYPSRQALHHSHITSPFTITSAIEQHNPDYSVLDVIIIESGPGKNQIFLEEENAVFRENFTDEVINTLPDVLEGVSIEAYVVEGEDGERQFIHPSADIISQSPVGLVPHQVGFLQEVHVDKESLLDRIRIRAKAVFNDSALAQDLRAVIKSAIERGAKFVPAPSINGMMLWSPQRRKQQNFFDALRVLSMRSVEFVSRPAAGGAIYAVIEGERMNMLNLLKSYCKRCGLTANYEVNTPAAFLESVTNPDDTMKQVQTALSADSADESAAMAILTEAALNLNLDTSDTTEQENIQEITVDTEAVSQTPTPAGNVTVNVQVPSALPVELQEATLGVSSEVSEQAIDTENSVESMETPVLEQVQELTNLVRQNAKTLAQQAQINQTLLSFVSTSEAQSEQNTMVAMVQESINNGLPEHRRPYWMKMIQSGQIKDIVTLKQFLDNDREVEATHEAQVVESFQDLPVSTRYLNLAGISVGTSERDIPKVRAKILFHAPVTEAEQKIITERSVRPYLTLNDMYKDLVPGDPDYTGIPYGGKGPKYRAWYSRNVLEGVTSGDDTVKSTDFANILLQVVGELGLSRWEVLDTNFLKLCETGPIFTNYIDSNVVIYGAAPDMEEWSEDTGYPDLAAGARKPVTTTVKDWGGIMRWSKRIVIDNRLDMITEDVNAQIDATWRAVGKHVFDKLLGIDTNGIINNLAMGDGNGVLYQAAGIRRNYVDGDGRNYANLVSLLHFMMEQEDIAKAGQEPQMLNLLPGHVYCVSNAWANVNGYFMAANKPGTDSEPNELGLPTDQRPMVIGVHQNFLRQRQDFVGMIPNPAVKGVMRIQYLNGQTTPRITWQNQPSVGRVFENGEIACQFDFPVRITLVREKGAYASFLSA